VIIIWRVRGLADKWTSALRLVTELALISDVILLKRIPNIMPMVQGYGDWMFIFGLIHYCGVH